MKNLHLCLCPWKVLQRPGRTWSSKISAFLGNSLGYWTTGANSRLVKCCCHTELLLDTLQDFQARFFTPENIKTCIWFSLIFKAACWMQMDAEKTCRDVEITIDQHLWTSHWGTHTKTTEESYHNPKALAVSFSRRSKLKIIPSFKSPRSQTDLKALNAW